jgi:hypothetical protein
VPTDFRPKFGAEHSGSHPTRNLAYRSDGMSDRQQVIEDGVAPAPAPEPGRPSWVLVLVGFVVGLGLGIVVVQPPPQTDLEVAAVTTTTVPERVASTVLDETQEGDGVSDVIPGFPDAIVGVARTSGSALEHVLWPVSGEPITRAMTGGGDVALDAGSQFIAMSEELSGTDGRLLSLGRFNTIRALTTGVSSYAWHDSTIGSLAYTVEDDGGTGLYTVRADLQSDSVVDLLEPEVAIVGWGDWGWALQQGPGEIALLNPDGEFKDSEAGVALATHPSGWIFAVEDDEEKLVSSGGGVRRLDAALDVGTPRAARFSPDASKVGVAGTFGIDVIVLDTGDVMSLADFPAPSLSWSSDSRFLVAPTAAGIVVFDLESPTRGYVALRPYWFLAAGVTPLSPS